MTTAFPDVAVGDLNSDARGTGARRNGGKAPVELLPLRQTAQLILDGDGSDLRMALASLGQFQARMAGEDRAKLTYAIHRLCDASHTSLADMLYEVARVLDYGRVKYSEWNWAKGMPWSVCIASATRHMLEMIEDCGGLDPETGFSHAAHAVCNLLFLLAYLDIYPEGDDRPPNLLPAR